MNWKNYIISKNNPEEGIITHFIVRGPGPGAKPLNFDVGLNWLKSDHNDVKYITMLDIDSTLGPTILQENVDSFDRDPDHLGFVQILTLATNSHFSDFAKSISQTQSLDRFGTALFSLGGFALFYGHNATFRADVLFRADNFLGKDARGQLLITEDFKMMHDVYEKLGMYGIHVFNRRSGEFVPTSMSAFDGMWRRWIYGSIQILSFKFFDFMRSKKITLLEKFAYLMYAVNFIVNPIRPAILLLSLIFPILSATVFFVIFLQPILVSLVFMKFIYPIIENKKTITNPWIKKVIPKYFESSIIKLWDSLMFAIHSILVSNSILYSTVIASVKYMVGTNQGWKVTNKGSENKISILNALQAHTPKIIIFVSYLILTLVTAYNFLSIIFLVNQSLLFSEIIGLILYFASIIIFMISIMGVIVRWGQSRMKDDISPETATVKRLNQILEEPTKNLTHGGIVMSEKDLTIIHTNSSTIQSYQSDDFIHTSTISKIEYDILNIRPINKL